MLSVDCSSPAGAKRVHAAFLRRTSVADAKRIHCSLLGTTTQHSALSTQDCLYGAPTVGCTNVAVVVAFSITEA
jgi:hypothetical protein